MKLTEPLGNSLYAPLFIRCSLGAYFVMAGLAILDNLNGFILEVQSFKLLPDHMATLYAILLPYLEIGCGILLILGMWTTLGGLIASVLLSSFVYAFGIFPKSDLIFNKDIILLAAALSILYTGGGAFSVDRFRKNAA